MVKDFNERIIRAREDNGEALKIVREFEPLIKKCIKMYIKDVSSIDDAMQEGRIAVFRCIWNYDLSSPVRFEGYVKMAVIYCIRGFALKCPQDISLDEEIAEGGASLHDILEGDMDVEGDAIKKEELEKLGEALKRLPVREKEVIDRYFFEGERMIDICRGRRCHYMTVVKAKDRAIERLRRVMGSGK